MTEEGAKGDATRAPRGATSPVTFFTPPEETAPNPDAVPIDPRARVLLLPEVEMLSRRMADPVLRQEYALLHEGLTTGAVEGAAVARLENLLEMGLQTGRFRREHGPEGVILLNRLYQKTPRGRAVAQAAADVNAALAKLAGDIVSSVSIRTTSPGAYELVIETEQREMTVALTIESVRLVSVQAGL